MTTPAGPAPDDPEAGTDITSSDWSAVGVAAVGAVTGEEGGMARINMRMPDRVKARVDQAAAAEGLSVNAWLVRAAATALERADSGRRVERRGPQGAQRFTGWARS